MYKEVFEKLENNIYEQLISIEDELSILDSNDKTYIVDCINQFLLKYQRNKTIDISLLEKFKNEFSFEEYKRFRSTIASLSYFRNNNNAGIYNSDIMHCKERINNFIRKIKILGRKLETSINDDINTKDRLKRGIVIRNRILEILNIDDDYIISDNEFDILCSLLKSDSDILDEEEMKVFVFELLKYNTLKMKNKIEVEILKNQKEKEQRARLRQIMILKQKNSLNNETKNKEFLDDKQFEVYKSILSKEQYGLYKTAKEISNYSFELNSLYEEIFSKLKTTDFSWKKRLFLYDAVSFSVDKKAIISSDLKMNILPQLEKELRDSILSNETFDLLKKITDYYNSVVDEKENVITDYEGYLQNLNMTKELELYNNVNNLLYNSNVLINTNSQILYNTDINTLMKSLSEELETFRQIFTDLYFYPNLENQKLLDLCYCDLLQKYNNLNKLYEEIIYQKSDVYQEFVDSGKSFYDSASSLKNIYFFLPDKNSQMFPMIENDLLKEEEFNDTNYEATVKKFHDMISDNELNSKSHKLFNYYFSSSFIKKYHPKSMHNGISRIFYSRFTTTIGDLFGISNPNVIFVFQITNGSKDDKYDSYSEGARRLKKYSNFVDENLELLTINWNELSDGERQIKKELLINTLKHQCFMLGHLIKKFNQNTMESDDDKEKMR